MRAKTLTKRSANRVKGFALRVDLPESRFDIGTFKNRGFVTEL